MYLYIHTYTYIHIFRYTAAIRGQRQLFRMRVSVCICMSAVCEHVCVCMHVCVCVCVGVCESVCEIYTYTAAIRFQWQVFQFVRLLGAIYHRGAASARPSHASASRQPCYSRCANCRRRGWAEAPCCCSELQCVAVCCSVL